MEKQEDHSPLDKGPDPLQSIYILCTSWIPRLGGFISCFRYMNPFPHVRVNPTLGHMPFCGVLLFYDMLMMQL